MAAIQMGGKSGKRPVDHEIPLIPFIDLLLCCVMFLLATAVWTHLSSLEANQIIDGGDDPTHLTTHDRLILQVQSSGFVLASTAGDRIEIPAGEAGYDMVELRERLEHRRELAPNERAIIVAPEDGVSYEHVIEAMDAVTGAGFSEMSLSDGALM